MGSDSFSEDRTTVGVSSEGERCLALLMSRGWFDKELSAFRVAIAYALAHQLPPTEQATYTTKWNKGSLEQQGDMLADLITQFYDTERPYDLAQSLGDAGLRALAERVQSGDSLAAILGSYERSRPADTTEAPKGQRRPAPGSATTCSASCELAALQGAPAPAFSRT